MRKKLKNCSGESLIESLLSIMIVALAVLALSTAVVTATRMNRSAKEMPISITYSGSSDSMKVYCDGAQISGASSYQENGFYYYEY